MIKNYMLYICRQTITKDEYFHLFYYFYDIEKEIKNVA